MNGSLLVRCHRLWTSADKAVPTPPTVISPRRWMHIECGKVLATGIGDPPEKILATNPRMINVPDNCTVMPGLIDSHIHIALYGESLVNMRAQNSSQGTLQQCTIQLQGCRSLQQLRDCVLDAHRSLRDTSCWIVGYGWDQQALGIDEPLTAKQIDQLVGAECQNPIALFRTCFHLCSLNAQALNILGLSSPRSREGEKSAYASALLVSLRAYLDSELQISTRKSSDATGNVRVDDATNAPNGIITETALWRLKEYLFSQYSDTELETIYESGLQHVLRRGVTSVQSNDAGGAWRIYKSLQRAGRLPIRVYLTVPFTEVEAVTPGGEEDADLPLPNDEIGLLSCHRVKLFADGSLGAGTAALNEPYEQHRCTTGGHKHGMLIHDVQSLQAQVAAAHARGYRLEVHAIGDRAADAVLDAFENAGMTAADRPILTHCQILGKRLVARMQQLGVIANIQPSFVASDAPWIAKCIGDGTQPATVERVKYSYAWKTLLQAGVHCAGGSDAPIEDPNPFWGMHAAVYRESTATPNTVYRPEERLTFTEALSLYTDGGAFCAGEEDRLGRLERGYQADFVVVESPQDLATGGDSAYISLLRQQVRVRQVWVAGVLRYDDQDGSQP